MEAPSAEAAPAPVVVTPPPRPKLFFHSPLDAPTMSATAYTSMGYFSADSSSQFEPGRVVAPVATLVSNNGLTWGEEGESAEIHRLQSVYRLPRTGLAGTLTGRTPTSAYASN